MRVTTAAVRWPLYSDPVRGILGRQADEGWCPPRAKVFQADEAHTGNATSADQFGLKRGREQALQHDWINSEIDEDPSIDHASYHR